MNKVLAFDIEIVKEIPEGVPDWKEVRPLGISCAALLLDEDPLSELHYHKEFDLPTSGGMNKEELQDLVSIMENHVNLGGYKIVTWNGLGFDFNVLAEESGMYEQCKELAMNHIDMAFHFLCVKGYMIGLEAAATGLGFSGKMAGMSGAQAPQLWSSPNLRDRLRVLRYVHQDVVTTMEVYEESSEIKRIPWTSRSGKPNTFWFQEWLPVKDCLDLPFPDTSWMDDPMKREDFYEWTLK